MKLQSPRKVAYRSEGRMPELPLLPRPRAGAAGIGEHAMTGHTIARLASVGIPTTNLKCGNARRAWITFLANEMGIFSSQVSAATGRSPAGLMHPGTELIRGIQLGLPRTILQLECRLEHVLTLKASTVNWEPKAKRTLFGMLALAAVRTKRPKAGRLKGARRRALPVVVPTSHKGLAAPGPTVDRAPAQRQLGVSSTSGM